MFYKFIMLLALIGLNSHASISTAKKIHDSRGSVITKYKSMVIELVDAGFHFSAIPWMKEYLTRSNKKFDSKLERAFEELVAVVGPRQFETLPLRSLKTQKSNSLYYIIAKKSMRAGKYKSAINYAKSINPNHPVRPFASNLLGAASANLGRYETSLSYFQECQRLSESMQSKARSELVKNQLKTNHDYCLLGEARSLFASKKYKEAELKYLDIPKSSAIWPEVLFEEAWSSYYLNNYNRTLGKLVTYNAPIFDYVFNPEIETLRALSFLKLCLYPDAKKISDDFYKNYMQPARKLRSFLRRNKSNYRSYYRMMADFEKLNKADSALLTKILKSVSREGAFQEVRESLIMAAQELDKVNALPRSRFKNSLGSNLNEVIQSQKKLMGAYVRSRLVGKYADLYRAFEGMSYIKLEVLEQRKARLYRFDSEKGKRGDIKYIERNEKQYFWNFNGEFWADELGDYVFALGSEC
ncbi:MAG: hypothetical protein KC478_03745 [Bacteriovoracaceae bacterium]|nr:hypothetical protein [Bacteriovoracaceae bacterium]